ncbi:ATP-binding cassette sub-family A member 2-like [Hyposmocoma kahamanoa]|uniref:ATP-binding cassette sub-family A member 2-like n=1 Tax=Hyposmocoma kahamanoa TaxID=1477025 RepID=UPI000E6D70FE|nr:ATP-binding cassette sub-family A member 2-like [Hyposmocoma kahamanoa]
MRSNVDSIRKSEQTAYESVKWTKLISGIKNLYVTVQRDYPYLFEYGSYGMDENQLMEVDKLLNNAKKLWFDRRNISRSIRLGINLSFRLLDLVDREIWNVTNEGWLKMKYSLYALRGPMEIFHDLTEVVAATFRNETTSSNLPPVIVSALEVIIPSLPQLIVDMVDIVIAGETQLEPIIELLNANPPWPCSTSLSELLQLSDSSANAVRSLETLMCTGEDMHEQWKEYLVERNVTVFCTALLGQNGAGKSTTFAMLTGETRPTTGQIYLNEQPANHLQLCKGLISYCPQTDAIDPLATVRETLQFYCRLRGITDMNEVIRRTLEMFELSKYADVRNGTLSGGNKRKLCTAIAFMGRTPVVLLDEPTSGMDPWSRECVRRGAGAAGRGGRALLLSTHALDDARRLAARVALLRGARLAALADLDACLGRFGGGFVVACRCRSATRDAWRRVKQRAPHAQLKVLHHSVIHFLLPVHASVNKKEVTTKLSDVFRLMAELQSTCDIEDYTVNQSSLDQMFLSFTEKSGEEMELVDIEPLPSPTPLRRDSAELSDITSL